MKKLLCLLLSILLVLSLVACGDSSDKDDDDDRKEKRSNVSEDEETGKSEGGKQESYETAIDRYIEYTVGTISKSNFKKLLPTVVWDYFEDEGEDFETIYADAAEELEWMWEDYADTYGDDFKASYKITDKSKTADDEYEEFIETVCEECDMDPDDFGKCYTIEAELTISGSEDEDTDAGEIHVFEYDGKWYVAELLMEVI